MKLTIRSCAAAPLGFTWDSQLPGFGLRVLPSGRRSFILRYRNASGTERLVTIGTLAEMTPEKARDVAAKMRISVREGGDPRTDRRRARQAPTLAEMAKRFLADHASQKKAGTARNYEISWRLHVLPALGSATKVTDITEEDILRLRKRMEATPYNANRTLELLRLAFKLAERWRWRPQGSNPALFVDDFPETPRTRILTEEEIARLWDALDGPHDPSFSALVRLLLLTGRRLDEWRTALWSSVDLDRATLTLTDSKAGAMTHSLPDAAVEFLRGMPRKSVFIFPGRTGGPLGGHQRMWQRLRRDLGIEDVRLHDLRHTAGSYAHRAGLTQREVADMLGHRQISTAARYIHGVGTGGQRLVSEAAAGIIALAVNK